MELKKIQVLGAVFATLLMVGCASNQTADDDAARAAAEREAAERAAALAAEQDAMRARESLQAAADAAGRIVYFDFDQATLRPESRATLDAHIAVLKGSEEKVRVEGHCDERGTREYNMALGERRANAVANYMIINGVARYRIETVSYGEERPAVSGSNEAAWSQNRRAELQY